MFKKLQLWPFYVFIALFFILPLFRSYLHVLDSALFAQGNDELANEADPDDEKLKESRYRSLYNLMQNNDTSFSFTKKNSDRVRNYDSVNTEKEEITDPFDFSFSENLWNDYQILESDRNLSRISDDNKERSRGIVFDPYDQVKLKIYGNAQVHARYSDCTFLTDNDVQNDRSICTSNAIGRGFDLNMRMKVSIRGKVGKKVSVDVDYDNRERTQTNTFAIRYKALSRRELVQEVTIGNIDLVFPKSEFALFEQRSKQAIGVEGKLKRGKLTFHTIATLTQGESAVEVFYGTEKQTSTLLSDFKYIPKKYYQLEPYIWYGDVAQSCRSGPTITSASYARGNANSLATLSSYLDTTTNFVGQFVDINNVELFLDDADSTNDVLAPLTRIFGSSKFFFHKLQLGSDYTVNTNTGRITMIRFLQNNQKLLARYNRSGGTISCDPAHRVIDSKIEVMLKWDGQMHEDTNYDGSGDIVHIDDGVVNLDAYEVRGAYNLRAQDITEKQLIYTLYNRNLETIAATDKLGIQNAILDRLSGTLIFPMREPFKNLTELYDPASAGDNLAVNVIYAEAQGPTAGDNSKALLRVDYAYQTRNYKLNHFNIIRGSEIVRLHGNTSYVIPPTKYYIDYQSGFFTFNNPNDPLIGPNDRIEISYEYSPFGATSQGYILGLRNYYEANRNVKIGGTVLFHGQFEPTEAPRIRQEPVSRLVLETDIDVNFKEERLTKLINTIPGADFDLLPIQIEGYAEYAKSFFNPNTFGLALIDDMESSEEVFDLNPLDDIRWIPSSLPAGISGLSNCNRGELLFKYYRNANNPGAGFLSLSSGATATRPYTEASGPYTVGEGHLDSEQLDLSSAAQQVSLVMDFNFDSVPNDPPFVGVMHQNFAQIGQDMSNVTYLEFYARVENPLEGGSLPPSGIRLYFDVGDLNEDTDGDGVVDTEDVGIGAAGIGANNNTINRNSSTGETEDQGFEFNPPDDSGCSGYTGSLNTFVGRGANVTASTVGNGSLDSEDINRDRILDTAETVLTFDLTGSAFHLDRGTSSITTAETGTWKHFRVFIDPLNVSTNDLLALKKVRSIRMYATPVNPSERGRGRILISSIRFGGSKWRSTFQVMNNTLPEIFTQGVNSDVFRAAVIDNQSSKDEYKAEAFIDQQTDAYEALHGKKTNVERAKTREAALKLVYNFGNASSATYKLLIRRVFATPLDLRFYKTIVTWVNYRTPTNAAHNFVFRIGSSDSDYAEYTSPVSGSGWQQLSFSLDNPKRVNGNPNLKLANTMFLGVSADDSSNTQNVEHSIWVNDIYVTDPQVQTDGAFKYQTTVRITKPLFKTKSGVPILSDIVTNYKRKHRGRQFVTTGQTSTNQDEDNLELLISSVVLPFWNANYTYTKRSTQSALNEQLEVLNQTGNTETTIHAINNKFSFKDPNAPVITANYQYQRNQNQRGSTLAGTIARSQVISTDEITHSPAFIVDEQFPEFFSSKLKYQMKSSFSFYEKTQNTVTRATGILPQEVDEQISREQTEETLNIITYTFKSFSLTPSFAKKRVLLVTKNFQDLNNEKTIGGNFYTPFLGRPGDFRYRQRHTNYKLQTSYRNAWIFSPELNLTAQYQENSFKDNLQVISNPKYASIYQRTKTPNTIATTRFSIPVNLKKHFPKLKFIRSFIPSFRREVALNETALPFTEKADLYEDDLGIRRTLPPIADRAYNLIKYPFWFHFFSPDPSATATFANGRNFVQGTSFNTNEAVSFSEAFESYDNSLSLKETLAHNAQWDFYKPLVLRTEFRLAQDISRASKTNTLPIHTGNWGFSVFQTYNLIQMLDFGFWSHKTNNSTLEANIIYDKNLLFTQNRIENKYNPNMALSFKWFGKKRNLSSVTFRLGIIYRNFGREVFFDKNSTQPDELAIANAISDTDVGIREDAITYRSSIEYATQVLWLKRYLSRLTKLNLRYPPTYIATISGEINRLEFDLPTLTQTSEKDFYKLTQKLDANLHANITAGIEIILVWEILRNINDHSKRQELIGTQIGINAKILF